MYRGERERNMILAIDVIDGDTFVLEDKHKVRLSNVDAPELKLCGAKESKKRLEEHRVYNPIELLLDCGLKKGRLAECKRPFLFISFCNL